MTNRSDQITTFLKSAGMHTAQRRRVAGDASNRRYDRLTAADGTTRILMDAPPDTGEDVRPFVHMSHHLRSIGLSAPAILHQNPDLGLLLIEDFGDALFADLIATDPTQENALYRSASDVLIHLHRSAPPDLPLCDASWLCEMIGPLFEWFAPDADPKGVTHFMNAFQPLAEMTAGAKPVLILRDYHAQNLILLPDRDGVAQVGLLDFQDAIVGHPAYDLVSILQDARRDVSAEVESQIIQYMIDHTGTDPGPFRAAYALLGLQRNLRILGIFARLCLRDGKPSYVDMIPRVWGYVERNLAHPDLKDLSQILLPLLPNPTPVYLNEMKRRCPPSP